MYYPYLRGKQFELITLREFAFAYNDYKVTPIIEPVKESFNSMRLTINTMKERGLGFALILNPQVGDIKDKISFIEESLSNELADQNNWYPAFVITNDNQNKIFTHINQKKYNNVFLICNNNLDSSSQLLLDLFQMERVTHIIINGSNSRLKRLAVKRGKLIIRLDDNFILQRKNSDYANISEEMFSEEYKFYKSDGFSGISDYTILPGEFIEGGMLPYAIAIHWTYEKDNNAIWIGHFVSDNNDGRENIQGKFFEAGKKAIDFFDEKKIPSNHAMDELKTFINGVQYPGLGVIKKMSIKNHIELLNRIIE